MRDRPAGCDRTCADAVATQRRARAGGNAVQVHALACCCRARATHTALCAGHPAARTSLPCATPHTCRTHAHTRTARAREQCAQIQRRPASRHTHTPPHLLVFAVLQRVHLQRAVRLRGLGSTAGARGSSSSSSDGTQPRECAVSDAPRTATHMCAPPCCRCMHCRRAHARAPEHPRPANALVRLQVWVDLGGTPLVRVEVCCAVERVPAKRGRLLLLLCRAVWCGVCGTCGSGTRAQVSM
jgi:hypothetical protein